MAAKVISIQSQGFWWPIGGYVHITQSVVTGSFWLIREEWHIQFIRNRLFSHGIGLQIQMYLALMIIIC